MMKIGTLLLMLMILLMKTAGAQTTITIRGVVPFTVSATDNVAVVKVEFYVDFVLKLTKLAPDTGTTSSYSFPWDTKSAVNGVHTLLAKAYDAAGNAASASEQVTVANDVLAPTASITAPLAAAIVQGTVSVSATATDDFGVTKAELWVDGVRTVTSASTASPYLFAWNTLLIANGAHSLTVKAYDAAGNVGTSAAVSVTVNNPDMTPPVITITAPLTGTSVAGVVKLAANASDNRGVTKVLFYISNGTTAYLKGASTAAPYVANWDTTYSLLTTPYKVWGVAYDAANNQATSAPVYVTVTH